MFDLLAGIRFAGMDLSLKGPGPADVELTRDLSLTDVYGGGRVILPLIEKWLVALRGDVDTGTVPRCRLYVVVNSGSMCKQVAGLYLYRKIYNAFHGE